MAENLILSLLDLPKYKPVLVECFNKMLEGNSIPRLTLIFQKLEIHKTYKTSCTKTLFMILSEFLPQRFTSTLISPLG